MRVRELQFSVKERLFIGQNKTGYKKDEREKKEKEDEKERSKYIRQKNKHLIRHVRYPFAISREKYAFSVAILIFSHSHANWPKTSPRKRSW